MYIDSNVSLMSFSLIDFAIETNIIGTLAKKYNKFGLNELLK